jgi:hypothetical protein
MLLTVLELRPCVIVCRHRNTSSRDYRRLEEEIGMMLV